MPTAAPTDPLDVVFAALGFDPVTLDVLVVRTGCTPAELNVRLLDLEFEGRVGRQPGQRFQRVARV
jgi:DNA processing protein